MVLLNTIVIIHDIPLINNPVIIEPCQIIFSPHRFKDSRSISWQENHFEEGGDEKKLKEGKN